MTSPLRAALLVALATTASGCAASFATTGLLDPAPNVVPRVPSRDAVWVDVTSLPSGVTCTPERSNQWTLCVRDLRGAMSRGLDRLLRNYGVIAPAAAGAGTARFAMVDLRLITQGRRTAILLVWQFALMDPSGHPIVQLAETTVGPEDFDFDADRPVTTLLEVVLERIGNALNAAHWPS